MDPYNNVVVPYQACNMSRSHLLNERDNRRDRHHLLSSMLLVAEVTASIYPGTHVLSPKSLKKGVKA